MELRRNGEFYEVSPWALLWEDENYYLIGYDSAHKEMRHYRVDKMKNINVSEETVKGLEQIKNESYAKYSNRLFGMFSGDDVPVRLKVDNSLIGVMIDRFGQGIPVMNPTGGETS